MEIAQDIFDLKHQTIFGIAIRMLIDKKTQDPWFHGEDVCNLLKYNKYLLSPNNFFKILKQLPKNSTRFSNKQLYINQQALFYFIMKSKTNQAKMFKSLLIETILPNFFFKQISPKPLTSYTKEDNYVVPVVQIKSDPKQQHNPLYGNLYPNMNNLYDDHIYEEIIN